MTRPSGPSILELLPRFSQAWLWISAIPRVAGRPRFARASPVLRQSADRPINYGSAARPSRARLPRSAARLRLSGDAGERIALVPTMGALHRGHLALVREARRRAAAWWCRSSSIRRNSRRTRTSAAIRAALPPTSRRCARPKADLVWAPSAEVMYPEGFATRIEPQGAAKAGLEDKFRPHFFGGVATVVAKLFTQVAPDFAMFGEKDYQQLRVVTQMAKDLDLPLKVIGVPTVREKDGLALSSRNAYLSAAERARRADALIACSRRARRASSKASRSKWCWKKAAPRSRAPVLRSIIWRRATR